MEKTFTQKFIDTTLEKLSLSLSQKQELLKLMKASVDDIESFLMKQKLLSAEQMTQLKGEAWNLPYVNIGNRQIGEKIFSIIPLDAVKNYEMLCFQRDGNTIHVGMVHPENYQAIEALDFLSQKIGVDVEIHIVSKSSFDRGLKANQTLDSEVEDVIGGAQEKLEQTFSVREKEKGEMETVIREAPITKIISVIIKHAVDAKASDIHIEPIHKKTRVRYRVDGVLRNTLFLPKYIHSALVTRVKVLANLKLDETRVPQDGRMRVNVGEKEVDFRVSTLPLYEYEKVVLRILETSEDVPTLSELGFNESFISVITENIRRPHGIFLATGPTGSGKSTTLYSILNMLNKESVNIVTLEDPIEYYMDGVNQSQVKAEVNYDFASGLRSILRQDPNIIMVGEIRDPETAKMAINAGLTGHLLFSTIHTNNAIGVVPRLMDMEVEPFLIASTLNILISQRLTRRLCQSCKLEQDIPLDLKNKIRSELDELPAEIRSLNSESIRRFAFFKSAGCDMCNNLGYSGRIAISELLEVTPELQKIIYEGYTLESARIEQKRQGMITLQQDGILRALGGATSIEEVLRVTEE